MEKFVYAGDEGKHIGYEYQMECCCCSGFENELTIFTCSNELCSGKFYTEDVGHCSSCDAHHNPSLDHCEKCKIVHLGKEYCAVCDSCHVPTKFHCIGCMKPLSTPMPEDVCIDCQTMDCLFPGCTGVVPGEYFPTGREIRPRLSHCPVPDCPEHGNPNGHCRHCKNHYVYSTGCQCDKAKAARVERREKERRLRLQHGW